MTLISYAANFEDVLLARALAHVEHGQYIDVGAADPRVASATQALYERGWHGVNLEPAPAHARQLRIARPADVTLALAAGATAGRRPFFDIPGTPLSTFDAERARQHRAAGHEVLLRDAETRTLDQVWDEQLDEHAPLQLLHIGCDDAAGVLAGLDLARHRPWLIVLPADTTLPALSGAGYHLAYDDGHKRFYVAAEQAALAAALRLPPQPADGFVLCEDHPYSHPLAAWRARADAAEAAAAEARTWSLAHVEEWKQKYGQLTAEQERAAALEAALAAAQLAAEQALQRHVEAEVRRVEAEQRRADAELAERTAQELHREQQAQQQLAHALAQRDNEHQRALYAERQLPALLARAADAARAEAALDGIVASLSWRLTRPLRAGKTLLRRVLGGLRRLPGRVRGAAVRRVKRVLGAAVRYVNARPALSFFLRRQISRLPFLVPLARALHLRTRLGAMDSPAADPAPTADAATPADLSHLPEAAQRIVHDLRRRRPASHT